MSKVSMLSLFNESNCIEFKSFVMIALKEDAPNGDITSKALNLSEEKNSAKLIAKQDLILSGIEIAQYFANSDDFNVELNIKIKNGDFVKKGDTILELFGSTADILQVERIVINFVAHLSGVATLTKSFVDKTKHTKCKILDTRKTLPLYRNFHKQAVVHGGGQNHRLNLSHQGMLKENHLRSYSSISQAVESFKQAYPDKYLTLEVTNIEEFKEALNTTVDQIMLDNMGLVLMKECVELNNQQAMPKKIEGSGNMTLDRVKAAAETGLDYISVGALTHSAPQVDMSLLFPKK